MPMTLNILAFLTGILWTQQLSQLPSPALLLIPGGLALVCGWRQNWLMVWLCCGLLWASSFGHLQLANRLPEHWVQKDLVIEGYINSLPQSHEHHQSFDFSVTKPDSGFPQKLRLSWYQTAQALQAGQSWQFCVRLKPAIGHLNPAGFDYETWLFANRIGATGYVRDNPVAKRLPDTVHIGRYFAHWRQTIANRMENALPDGPQLAVIKALTIGSQSGISQEQWNLFSQTGITHLIVISGSHISLIAGLIFLGLRKAWARTGILRYSPPQIAAIGSWLSALFYGGLAGYSIPTLRAVIMLSIVMAALLWQRHHSAWQILLTALLGVLLFDPLAVVSIGFWLSFLSVALLLYVSTGRLGLDHRWQHNLRLQLASSLGLLPVIAFCFQQVSLISPLANGIAIPVIGVGVVPVSLLASALLFIAPSLASHLLWLCDQVLQLLYQLLQTLASWPLAHLDYPEPPPHALLFSAIGILLLLAPKGFPCRYLAMPMFLPLLFIAPDRPRPGEIYLTLLDVGQGLAIVVQTHTHTLVFDTGGKLSQNADMGASVLVPFLRQQAIRQVDQLIISHNDNDHSGGTPSLLAALPVRQIRSSSPLWSQLPQGKSCLAGEQWQWDGVSFMLLAPPETGFAKENDNSCVLKIDASVNRFLLSADIEKSAEQWLTEQYGSELHSEVLIAPHHGSKTSSSAAFLAQVKPQWILISAAYLNRFGFPHPQVLARYQQQGSQILNTATQGAITVRSEGQQLLIQSQRTQRKRYWRLF